MHIVQMYRAAVLFTLEGIFRQLEEGNGKALSGRDEDCVRDWLLRKVLKGARCCTNRYFEIIEL